MNPTLDDEAAQWLPVSATAARLGISERTVQRRAASGKLEARTVSDEQGKRLLIRLDLPTPADNLTAPTHAQTGEADATLGRPADTLTAHLLSENAFLRGVIEQLQRDGAETRAALRKALEVAPRQLEMGSDQTARNAQNGPQNSEAGSNSQQGKKGPEIEADGAKSGLSYGDIADALERELNR